MTTIRQTKIGYYLYSRDLGISCWKRHHTGTADTPPRHAHKDFYELVVVSGGSALHWYEGQVQRLSPGTVLLIQPEHPHDFLQCENLEIYNILFTKEFYNLIAEDLGMLPGGQLLFRTPSPALNSSKVEEMGIRMPMDKYPEIIRDLNAFSKMKNQKEPGIRSLTIAKFIEIVYSLAKCCTWGTALEKRDHAWQIKQILNRVCERLGEPWSLEKMARCANLSVSLFRQEFKKMMLDSPMNYLLKLRLRSAADKLLQSPSLPLNDVAMTCGFYNISYFNRQFKRHFGFPPAQFRKQLLSQESNRDQLLEEWG